MHISVGFDVAVQPQKAMPEATGWRTVTDADPTLLLCPNINAGEGIQRHSARHIIIKWHPLCIPGKPEHRGCFLRNMYYLCECLMIAGDRR